MVNKLIILVVLVSVSTPVFAQSVDTAWVRGYNGPADSGDFATAIAVDRAGNVYVTGWSAGIGTNYDFATIKYTPDGSRAWVRRYDGQGSSDYASAIAVDSSGNIYVTGSSWQSGTGFDYATIKYYPNGDTAWIRRYTGPGDSTDEARAIGVDAFGNVYVTGQSYSSLTNYDYATIEYHPNGDTAWVSRYTGIGGYSADYATALALDTSGHVYVTGSSMGSGTSYDYASIKYRRDGDTLGVRRYNGLGNKDDYANAIAVDLAGNIYVTGYVYGGIATSYDYATIKYYSTGDTAWVRTYNGTGNLDDYANAIAVDGSGNVYVTGGSWGSGTGYDYVTIKYYPNGDTAWVRRYDGPGNGDDIARTIAVDGSGNVYVSGKSIGAGTDYDYATIKYYSNGNSAWVKRHNGLGNSIDSCTALAVDGSGSVYVTGASYGSTGGFNYFTIKYVQFLRGDANSDKKVTIADIVYLVSYLFKGGPAPNPIQSGDANCDGKVTIADIVYLVSYLFKHGPTPCH